jgi:hypothetical protein
MPPERLGSIQADLDDVIASSEGEPVGGDKRKADTVLQRQIDRFGQYVCVHCEGTVLLCWRYCPECGGEIVWAGIGIKKGEDAGT